MAAQQSHTTPCFPTEDAITIEWQDLQLASDEIRIQRKKSEQINVRKSAHSDQKETDENKVQHAYALETIWFAPISKLDEWVEGAQSKWESWARATGSAFGMVALVVPLAAASLLASPHDGVRYFQNKAKAAKWNQKKSHNKDVQLFNKRLQRLKAVTTEIQRAKRKMEKYEQAINSSTFKLERMSGSISRVLLCIGPTGFGKSVVCNRLIGDERDVDSLQEPENDEIAFKVAEEGETKSETCELSKRVTQVTLKHASSSGVDTACSFVLTVVDTPGALDSNGGDKKYLSAMAEYFRASGGVNMFCLFFAYGGKNDQSYQAILRTYEKFWGKAFWKQCVILITKCDQCNMQRVRKGLPKTKLRIQTFLEQEMGVEVDIPMYEFGDENFEPSIKKMCTSLMDAQSAYANKYKCDAVVSPIDQLWTDIQPLMQKYAEMAKELDALAQTIQETKDQLQQ